MSELERYRMKSRETDRDGRWSREVDTLDLLFGLIERCGVDDRGVPRDQRVDVGQFVIKKLSEGWPQHIECPELLSATIQRTALILHLCDSPWAHESAVLARVAPSLEEYPQALLALRSSGLVHSKKGSYTRAWLTLSELRSRVVQYTRGHANSDGPSGQQLREVGQQALLAETGTAARTVEIRLESLGFESFAEKGESAEGLQSNEHRRRRNLVFNECYTMLRRGVLVGSMAIKGLEDLVLDDRSLRSVAAPTWSLRPHVMTARCCLELLPLIGIVEGTGARTPVSLLPAEGQPDGADGSEGADPTWDDVRRQCCTQFEKSYGDLKNAISERPDLADVDHVRELLQLRLHATSLGLETQPLEGEGVPRVLTEPQPTREDLAAALRERKADANILMSITAPLYLAHMQLLLNGRTDENTSLVEWLLSEDNDDLRRRSLRERESWRDVLSNVKEVALKYVEGGDLCG